MTAVTTPAQAWESLREGNERFVAGTARHPHQDAGRRQELTAGQHPIAAILGCSDSRAGAEIVFDLGLGDAFVIRNAGQVASPAALGSIDYAVQILAVPLLVVLSHEGCGAVQAAIDSQAADAPALPPSIASLVGSVLPAVRTVSGSSGNPADPGLLDAARVRQEHLGTTVAAVLRESEIVSEAVAEGRLAIAAADYRLATGEVVLDNTVGVV